jgi:two-component system, chemotaxis family, CheB/CheR fusion protein
MDGAVLSQVYRRLERRRDLHKLRDLEDYSLLLQESPQEMESLFKELLIGVTRFFRDSESWEHGRNQLGQT